MPRNEKEKPRRGSLAACGEASKSGEGFPANGYFTTDSTDGGDGDPAIAAAYAERERAEAWISRRPRSWYIVKVAALSMAAEGQHVSLDRLSRDLRAFSMGNCRTPALTRLLVEECPELRGFVTFAPASCDAAFDWIE